MPIGGFVVNILPEQRKTVLKALAPYPEVEVYGDDQRGHLIVVIETESSEEMEALVERLSQIEGVINFDLAYLHGEDEVKKIEAGEIRPKIRFSRYRSRSEGLS